jgi:hypothetical protein
MMRKDYAVAIGIAFAFCTAGCAGDHSPSVSKVTTGAPDTSDTASGSPPATTVTPGTPTTSAGDPTTPPGTPGTPATGTAVWTVEASGTTDTLVGIWGGAANRVWVVGTHTILRSQGDGAWVPIVAAASLATDQYSAVFGDGDSVFVAGMGCDGGLCSSGVLLRSRDAGATWTRQTLAAPAWGFGRGGDGILYLALDGAVLASKDGFDTSESRSVGTLPAAHGVFVRDDASTPAGTALLAFGGLRTFEIRRSDDGGDQWATAYSGSGGSRSGSVNAMWGAGATVLAVAVGATVPTSFGALLRSDDGGASFTPTLLPELTAAGGVWGAGADDVYIAGSQLLHAADGHTFAPVELPVTSTWNGVWGSGAADVYVIGLGGTIAHYR